MTFEIEIDGRTRIVSVKPSRGSGDAGTRFRVTIDGRPRTLDVRRNGRAGLSLLFPEEGGASHDVSLAEAGRTGEWLVYLSGAAVRAVVDGRRALAAGADLQGAVDGEQRVLAPMPGRVVRVLVAPGDEVSARQGLVVVEAMKMENELGSPKAGRVKDVRVSSGMPVEAGRVLVVVE
jgi:biotin carboxyl carrier protein